MASALETFNMSVFSLGGDSFLGLVQNVTIDISNTIVETKSINVGYGRGQIEKSMAKISAAVMGNDQGLTKRIDHLMVSAFTIGGTSYLGKLRSGKIAVNATVVKKPEVGTRWVWTQITDKMLTIDGEFDVPTGVADALQTLAKGVVANQSVIVSLTLDDTADVIYTAPMVIESLQLGAEMGGLYKVTMKLTGQCPDSGTAFPTAPTATTSLFEKALNSRAAVAVALTTQSSNGNSYSFNACIASAELDISDEQIITATYSLESQGTVT